MKRYLIIMTIFYSAICTAQDYNCRIFEKISDDFALTVNNQKLFYENGLQLVYDEYGTRSIISNITSREEVVDSLVKSLNLSDFIPDQVYEVGNNIIVIDTTRFFTSDCSTSISGLNFAVSNKLSNEKDTSLSQYMYIYSIGVNEGYFIITFSFPNSRTLLNYYFELRSNEIYLVKKGLIER